MQLHVRFSERHRRLLSRGVAAALLSISALFTSGCGSDLAQVTGLVTVDGEPLRGGNGVRATVNFQPASGSGIAAVGLVGEDGSFVISTGSQAGIAPGDYKVTVTATQLIKDRENPNGPATGRRITDPRYANAQTSGFQFTVQPGGNEFNLPLNSAKPRPGARR
jgi:hypothetical protein